MPVDVKICGLSDRPGLEAAVRHGARMVGFVFFPASPRRVGIEELATLARGVPDDIERVGVTVDVGDDALSAAIDAGRLTVIQLHGAEDERRVAEVGRRFGVKTMKVVRVSRAADLDRASRFEAIADMLMFDARAPASASRPGGNARAFDWRLLEGRSWRCPWLLSGGLDSGNLRQAVEISGAAAVDVSSGVETSPGRKSPVLIADFLERARGI